MEFILVSSGISVLNYAGWLGFGGIAGFISHMLSENTGTTKLSSSILLGMLGALAGGTFATFLYGVGMQGIDLTSLAISLMSSLSFLVLFHMLVKPSEKTTG